MVNQEVFTMQKMLNAKGYRDEKGNRLVEDGIWGPKTEYVWKSYQHTQENKMNAPTNKSVFYLQRKMEGDFEAILNKQINKTQEKSTIASASSLCSWLETHKNNDPMLKKLETAMKAEPEARLVFSSPDKIRNEQISLNALGFTGLDSKELLENGILDINTVVAWDKLMHNGKLFGNAGSPIMKVVNGKNEEINTTTNIANIAKGMVPSTNYLSPVQSKVTGIWLENAKRGGKFIDQRQRTKRLAEEYLESTGKKLDKTIMRFDKPHDSSNDSSIHYDTHLNTQYRLADPNYPKQYKIFKYLDHNTGFNDNALLSKNIPRMYDVFKDFGKVKKIAKTGGKAFGVVGMALDVHELGSTIYYDLNDDDRKLGQDTVETAVSIGGSWAGGFTGAKLGAIGGASLGTLVCPGLGTVIGGFIGGIFGGIGGAYGGRELGEWAVEKTYEGI